MNKNVYAERRDYINNLSKSLAPMQDFGKLEYAYASSTNSEYLKISTVFGDSVFMDITAVSTEDILMDICRIVLRLRIKTEVCDINKKRQIAPLFTHNNVI